MSHFSENLANADFLSSSNSKITTSRTVTVVTGPPAFAHRHRWLNIVIIAQMTALLGVLWSVYMMLVEMAPDLVAQRKWSPKGAGQSCIRDAQTVFRPFGAWMRWDRVPGAGRLVDAHK